MGFAKNDHSKALSVIMLLSCYYHVILFFPLIETLHECQYHCNGLMFFLFFRFLDSSSTSSSMADADQSPASFLHSSPFSPSFGLEATPTLSPAHPVFLLPSPAGSSSSSSSSFSLHCGIPEPESPTGSSSSGGSLGGDALISDAATCFAAPQMGSFSAQVTIVCQKVEKKS